MAVNYIRNYGSLSADETLDMLSNTHLGIWSRLVWASMKYTGGYLPYSIPVLSRYAHTDRATAEKVIKSFIAKGLCVAVDENFQEIPLDFCENFEDFFEEFSQKIHKIFLKNIQEEILQAEQKSRSQTAKVNKRWHGISDTAVYTNININKKINTPPPISPPADADKPQTADPKHEEEEEGEALEPAKTKTTADAPAYSADFKRFWAAYPRKDCKVSAYEQWRQRIGEGASADSMTQAAKRYAEQTRVENRELKYIKFPSTFLHGAWTDYLSPDTQTEPKKPITTAEWCRIHGVLYEQQGHRKQEKTGDREITQTQTEENARETVPP